MRVLIFLIIILIAGYSILDLFGILNSERQGNILNQKQGIEKVKIPKELKEDYINIAKQEKKLFYNNNKDNLKIIKVKNTKKIIFSQNEDFPTKIKTKRTKQDILYIDLYVKNKTNKKYKGQLNLLCKTYDKDKNELDIFNWKKNISTNPNKVTLIKGIKLGYINDIINTKHIRCKVEKYKRY